MSFQLTMTVLRGARLVVPKEARKDVLNRLHASHQGIERTKARARQTVWWPAINSDITNTVGDCSQCQEHRDSLPKEPLLSDTVPNRVFEETSADFFTTKGIQFLVYCDRYSGWPNVVSFPKDTTSARLIKVLTQQFSNTGVPVILRSDGGPQFASSEFREFCNRWGVRHVFSSPHYPQSNGHAEVNVKKIKALINKSTKNGDINSELFHEGLLELRNTPNSSGRSPAEIVFGHPLRSCVPAHRESFAQEWQKSAKECDKKANDLRCKAKFHYDKNASLLTDIPLGAEVWIQDPHSKRWDKIGKVVDQGNFRDYYVKMPSGRVFRRNRRFLRHYIEPATHSDFESTKQESTSPADKVKKKVHFQLPTENASETPYQQPRRGTRKRRRRHRLDL